MKEAKPWYRIRLGPKPSRDERLSPSNLWFLAAYNSIHGDMFVMLDFFSGRIMAQGLKPWGPVGRRYLAAAMADTCRSDYYHWVICHHCQTEFKPAEAPETLRRFLDYWQDKADYDSLFLCPACAKVPPQESGG